MQGDADYNTSNSQITVENAQLEPFETFLTLLFLELI